MNKNKGKPSALMVGAAMLAIAIALAISWGMHTYIARENDKTLTFSLDGPLDESHFIDSKLPARMQETRRSWKKQQREVLEQSNTRIKNRIVWHAVLTPLVTVLALTCLTAGWVQKRERKRGIEG